MAAFSKRSPSPLVVAGSSYYPNPRDLEIYRRNCSDFSQRPSIRQVVGVPLHHHGKDPNAKALPASTVSLCLRLKPISLFLFLILVGCLWTPITVSTLVNFAKVNEPVSHFSVKESNNTVSHFSMIPNVKQSRNLHFYNFTNSVKEKNPLMPMKEMGIGIVQVKEANFSLIESQNHFSMIPTVKELRNLHICNFTNSVNGIGIVQLEEPKAIASHTDHEQALQGKIESKPILHGTPLVLEFEPIAEAHFIISEMKQKAQVPKASVIKSEMPPAEKPYRQNKLISNAEVMSSIVVSEHESSESEASTKNLLSFNKLHLLLKDHSYAVNFLWISLFILVVIVTAAFIFAKKLTVYSSMLTASMENAHKGRLSSRNWPTEVDIIGDLYPSEMGSFQRITSYSMQESKGASETQSQERGMRKSNKIESLTPSDYSISLPSYGSYTSYEKIHSKQVPKSDNDSEFLSKTITDQSLRPYDLESNYLAPRPRLLYYNPNKRIERIQLRERMGLEDFCTSESLCDTETSPPPSLASCLTEIDADSPSVPYDPKVNYLAPRPQFLFYKPNRRIEQIRLRQSRLLDCFSSEGSEEALSESSSIEHEEVEEGETTLEETTQEEPNVFEPRTTEVKVVSKSHSFSRLKPASLLSVLTLVACLWIPFDNYHIRSSIIDSTIGKELRLIPKESIELSFLRFNNSTDLQVDIVGSMCLVKENHQSLQQPFKELEIGTIQLKEPGVMVIEAYKNGEESLEVTSEFSNTKLTLEAEIIEKASQVKPELQEANLSLEESNLTSHEEQSNLAEKEQEGDVSQVSKVGLEGEKFQCDETPIFEVQIDHEAHKSIVAENEQKVPLVFEVEPAVQELQCEEKTASDVEVVVLSHIYHETLEAAVPQFSEIESKLLQVDNLISHVVESIEAVSELVSSKSQALIENSHSFKEPHLSLKEMSSVVKDLGIYLLILVLTVAATFIARKQQKSPASTTSVIHQELPSLRNWQTTVDIVDKSCPSEMSIFQRTTSYPKSGSNGASSASGYSLDSSSYDKKESNESCPSEISSFQRTTSSLKRGSNKASSTSGYWMDSPPSYSKKETKGASEAQSQERGLRKSRKRESLASSLECSKGSTSYGSYTSYEKIAHKHGCGGQKVAILVRRSCRIRNQIAST